jgi:hypothetical protein
VSKIGRVTSSTLEDAREILATVFESQTKSSSETERKFNAALVTALAPHRGASHALSQLKDITSSRLIQIQEEIARLQDESATLRVKLASTSLVESLWATSVSDTYNDVVETFSKSE